MVDILPLEASACVVTRDGQRLLGPVEVSISGAGATMVLGPNGAGKTTLLRLLHGLDRPSAGNLRWAVPKRDSFAHQSFVFQSPVMLRRSVRDNLGYPLMLRNEPEGGRVTDWLDRIGLTSLADQPARSLSRGERQKLALARALITTPQILFLDEPSASLDGPSTKAIEAILQQALQNGTRIVMSTHDIGQAKRLGTEVVFLHCGRVMETAPMANFFAAPQSPQARAFLSGEIVE